jgi:hypothetical protein
VELCDRARLGIARAYAMQGDTAKARAAYHRPRLKDADPDIHLNAASPGMRSSGSTALTSARRPNMHRYGRGAYHPARPFHYRILEAGGGGMGGRL